MTRPFLALALALCSSAPLAAQGNTYPKPSSGASTGTVVPGSCAAGTSFYKTDTFVWYDCVNGAFNLRPVTDGSGNLSITPTVLTPKGVEGPIFDKGGQVYNVQEYGWLPDGVDHSAAALALINQMCPSGVGTGGVLYFPPSTGTYRADSQLLLPDDGALPYSHSCNYTFAGAGSGSNWHAGPGFADAAVLDLRYKGSNGGKIEARGNSAVNIHGVTLRDGGTEDAYTVSGGALVGIVVTSHVGVATFSSPPTGGFYVGASGWAITGSTTSALNALVYTTAVSGSTITFAVPSSVANGTYNNAALTMHYSSPFVHVSNPTITVRDTNFDGNSGVSEDGVVLGGSGTAAGNDVNAAFQGYGTSITFCHFTKMNRGVYARAAVVS